MPLYEWYVEEGGARRDYGAGENGPAARTRLGNTALDKLQSRFNLPGCSNNYLPHLFSNKATSEMGEMSTRRAMCTETYTCYLSLTQYIDNSRCAELYLR